MAKNPQSSSKSQFIARILLVVGPALVTLSVSHNILRFRALSLNKQTIESISTSQSTSVDHSLPAHIYSEWFLDVQIDPAIYKGGDWTISPDNASYLVSSGYPGKGGNIIIYGHNKRSILGNIRAFKGYEIITLTLHDGSRHDYQIQSLLETSPGDVDLLQPTKEEVLTIYTCSGFLDSQRFVVRATPLDQVDAP